MTKLSRIFLRTVAVFALLGFISAAQAEIAVITNPGVNIIGLSKEEISNIYLGMTKTFSDGSLIKAVDQSGDSKIRQEFYNKVLGMSESQVNQYWAKLKFTGKGTPPKTLYGNEAVREWVASHPGAIGYIDGKYLDNSVKVVLIVQ